VKSRDKLFQSAGMSKIALEPSATELSTGQPLISELYVINSPIRVLKRTASPDI
jgi:hypothetical protein